MSDTNQPVKTDLETVKKFIESGENIDKLFNI